MKRILLGVLPMLSALWAGAAETPPSLPLGWDALLPGAAVRGLSETPVRGNSAEEARIYVGNVAAVSPPNCLVYDFSDFPAGQSRGYAALVLPASTNGWMRFSICFRRESGKAGGEIRGFYDLPGQGANGVKRAWPFLWLTFDEIFSVKAEGQPRWRTVRVGAVLPHVWHRATIDIPPPGATNAVGRATLERLGANGAFAPVGVADIPFGNLVLRRAASFDLTGAGPCKFLFDNLECDSVIHLRNGAFGLAEIK